MVCLWTLGDTSTNAGLKVWGILSPMVTWLVFRASALLFFPLLTMTAIISFCSSKALKSACCAWECFNPSAVLAFAAVLLTEPSQALTALREGWHYVWHISVPPAPPTLLLHHPATSPLSRITPFRSDSKQKGGWVGEKSGSPGTSPQMVPRAASMCRPTNGLPLLVEVVHLLMMIMWLEVQASFSSSSNIPSNISQIKIGTLLSLALFTSRQTQHKHSSRRN